MKPPKFHYYVSGFHRIKKSLTNFFKSAFLSLLIILMVLMLLTNMDQAFTLMVDLVENKGEWLALLLSFIFVNTLAISLSHYPIYNYYSSNLNNSGGYTIWKKAHPYRFWPLRKFSVYIFETNKNCDYKPDNLASYLRYALGLIIHGVWVHFIIKSYERNLIFDGALIQYKWVFYVLLLLPLVCYIYYKERFYHLSETDRDREKALLSSLGAWYGLVFVVSRTLLVAMLIFTTFSKAGFVLMYVTCLSLMFNYVFFRLARVQLSRIEKHVRGPLRFFIRRVQFLEKSVYYLMLYHLGFVLAVVYILYATLAGIVDFYLPNSIPILLAFFYFYYFIIANTGKYFFVSQKLQLFTSGKYKITFGLTLLLAVLVLVTNCTDTEVATHELDLVDAGDAYVSEARFFQDLRDKEEGPLFFIASHGGGTKASVWTLHMLNKLQQDTGGRLLDQTIALSGASGGSQGLALYTGLYREHGKDFAAIQKKIDAISASNFTSIDLTFTFGLDTYRKLWPLNQRIGVRDRSYYSMRKYQNLIAGQDRKKLSDLPYRGFLSQTYDKTGYFPSLIMNTAATNGKRGIFWSVKQERFQEVFPFAENLADLYPGKTLPYYQAVSTTDRFPVFSPAAKIPGYGHYIDAGAIDNSGLLGCMDLHNYLSSKDSIIDGKTIVYVEILNSKDLYVSHLVDKFMEQRGVEHIAIDENETDNIAADLQTALNIDKIPGYLGDYMQLLEQKSGGGVRHFQLFMPHKITLSDFEKHLNGTIGDKDNIAAIKAFLKAENEVIFSVTESPDKAFFEPWDYYEPTLSRHLSESSINYVRAILEHPLLKEQFDEIERLVN